MSISLWKLSIHYINGQITQKHASTMSSVHSLYCTFYICQNSHTILYTVSVQYASILFQADVQLLFVFLNILLNILLKSTIHFFRCKTFLIRKIYGSPLILRCVFCEWESWLKSLCPSSILTSHYKQHADLDLLFLFLPITQR